MAEWIREVGRAQKPAEVMFAHRKLVEEVVACVLWVEPRLTAGMQVIVCSSSRATMKEGKELSRVE